MSWSFVGRALVVIHTAMSVGVLAWAIGVATHRVHWKDVPATANAAAQEGIYTKQQACLLYTSPSPRDS